MFLQSLLSGANQLQDITNDQAYSDLVGLTWDQIQAAFPARLQLLADKTYDDVQRPDAADDAMAAFGVTDETQTVASMSAEQRLQCLHLIMNDRYGCLNYPLRLHSYVFSFVRFFLNWRAVIFFRTVFLSAPSGYLQIQRLSVFSEIAGHVIVLLVRGGTDPESG